MEFGVSPASQPANLNPTSITVSYGGAGTLDEKSKLIMRSSADVVPIGIG
jgi:hypothetical protein